MFPFAGDFPLFGGAVTHGATATTLTTVAAMLTRKEVKVHKTVGAFPLAGDFPHPAIACGFQKWFAELHLLARPSPFTHLGCGLPRFRLLCPFVRRRLPHQYAPRQAMSTAEDIALPRARRRCYNITITRKSWPAVASRPAVARMWPGQSWPGRPWPADQGRTRLGGDVTAVTSPSSVGRGDVPGRGHRLSRGILMGESASHIHSFI